MGARRKKFAIGLSVALALAVIAAYVFWPSTPIKISGPRRVDFVPTSAFSIGPRKISFPIPGGRFEWPPRWTTITPGIARNELCGYLDFGSKAIPDVHFLVDGMKIEASHTEAATGKGPVRYLVDLPYATEEKYKRIQVVCDGVTHHVELPVRPIPGRPAATDYTISAGPYEVIVHVEWPRLSYSPSVITLTTDAPPGVDLLLRGNGLHVDGFAWLVQGGKRTHVKVPRHVRSGNLAGVVMLLKQEPIDLVAKKTAKHGTWLVDFRGTVLHGKGYATMRGLGYEAIDYAGVWISEGPLDRPDVPDYTLDKLIGGASGRGTAYRVKEAWDFTLKPPFPPAIKPGMEIIFEPWANPNVNQRAYNPYSQ